MAVRIANQRAYMVGEGEFRKAIGETLVIISRHSTSCPLCKPFENKVLIDDVYSGGTQTDGDYMLLSEAMAQGLYHPRCRHGLGTYYPELEEINGYEIEDNKLNDYKSNDLGVAKSEKSDIIEAGGKSIVDFAEWDANRTEVARKQYDKIRSADDVKIVARNSGFSTKDIQAIKNHIFYKKHIKYDGEIELFEPDYDMAVAWKRLVEGNPEERDILLLKHELLESQLEEELGLTAAEAHERANQTYAWDKKLYEELGEGGEEDDLL